MLITSDIDHTFKATNKLIHIILFKVKYFKIANVERPEAFRF